MDKSKNTALYLKRKRISAGLTQGQVALKLHYDGAQMVSNWERGTCNPPVDKLSKILKVLRIDPEEYIEFVLEEQRQILRKSLGLPTNSK